MGDFAGQAQQLIPANVRMISGCHDSQTSADVSNVSEFQLPDPAGRSGGACTSALLKVLYNEHHKNDENLSFVDVLMRMRQVLGGKYTQIPQLTSSRKMDVHEKFDIVPNDCSGRRRAILIGINYVGQQGQLSGCHNDVGNIKDYIMDAHGFQEKDIVVLMDDGNHTNPTYDNIIGAFRTLVSETKAGDCAFLHYSGHGGRVPDDDNEEEDGYDETLIPVDYQSAGQIRDDAVFAELVGRMPEGSTLTCLMDCCHSGSVLDLPYTFKADGQAEEMKENPNTNFDRLQAMAIQYIVFKVFGRGTTGQIVYSLVGGKSNVGTLLPTLMSLFGGKMIADSNGANNMNTFLPILMKVFGMIKCG